MEDPRFSHFLNEDQIPRQAKESNKVRYHYHIISQLYYSQKSPLAPRRCGTSTISCHRKWSCRPGGRRANAPALQQTTKRLNSKVSGDPHHEQTLTIPSNAISAAPSRPRTHVLLRLNFTSSFSSPRKVKLGTNLISRSRILTDSNLSNSALKNSPSCIFANR